MLPTSCIVNEALEVTRVHLVQLGEKLVHRFLVFCNKIGLNKLTFDIEFFNQKFPVFSSGGLVFVVGEDNVVAGRCQTSGDAATDPTTAPLRQVQLIIIL